MSERIKGQERAARSDVERITIFRTLANEYLELISAVGPVSEQEGQADRNRISLSLRLMLERKFVAKSDRNTYIPEVLASLRTVLADSSSGVYLDKKQEEYWKIITGELTGVSGNFNHVELEFDKLRDVIAYGKLMHSDRDKFVSAELLQRNFVHLLVRQTNLLSSLISDVCDFIDRSIDSKKIPIVPDSLTETWNEIHKNPEKFGLGKRQSKECIPTLNDDGSAPLPGGPRRRTVAIESHDLG